ncbi:MAG: hypothetical protein F9K44_10990 [Hyphomicrobiaceae bacterium]|nr:MAG: hypothetical protein F9K44_10990 [Hyphomicrobiaceae bacterium]
MAIGLPARARDAQRFTGSHEEIGRAAIEVFKELGWTYTGSVPAELRASVGMSLWSWGERVQVLIGEDGLVSIESRGAMPMQWLDWGRNARNCQAFLSALARRRPAAR